MTPTFSDWVSTVLGRQVQAPTPAPVADLVASRAVADWSHLNVDLPALGSSHLEVELTRDRGRRLTAEIHVADAPGPHPVLVYLHGGGWFAGSAAGERRLAMRIAAAGAIVVSLDYALAPENPFPAALEDCLYAARWCTREIAAYGGDPLRITLGGASTGANLAAATIAALREPCPRARLDERGLAGVEVAVQGCLLLYGVYDLPDFCAEPGAFGPRPRLYGEAYLGDAFDADVADPLVSPERLADKTAFPPTYISCGSHDALLSQSLRFGLSLARAEVPTSISVLPGADHAFLHVPERVPGAAAEIERIGAWITTPAPEGRGV